MPSTSYNDSIFVNCPFDDEYTPLLQAIVYAIYRCGFIPQTALNEDDGTDNRLDKIIRIIESCRYGIHDISRTQLSSSGLPRFNMPFELGVFFGAKKVGNGKQRTKSGLVFEKKKFSYQKYISDLNGIDTKAHGNKTDRAIELIRNWLKTTSRRNSIPGNQKILTDFKDFKRKLPKIARELDLDPTNIPFNDYCLIVEEDILSRI